MSKPVGRILKGSDVKLEGQFHLGVTQVEPGSPKEGKEHVPLAAPEVRIVENHPEFAVIEVTCSCGTKTHLRCEYANAGSSAEAKPDQTK